MNDKNLNAFQIAALLISASCGIGFLFGSGELALKWSMAGSIYAEATAAGMAILAVFAKPIWKLGGPIWDVLRDDYGEIIARAAAGLSVVWLIGVLAAQILGGVAVLRLVGLSNVHGFGVMAVAIYVASQISLVRLSRLFTASLLGSLGILIYSVVLAGGQPIYVHAIPSFIQGLDQIPTIDSIVIGIAIVFVVVTGADYQQFVLAGKNARSAAVGCVAAAVFLLFMGFLPSTAVVAWSRAGLLNGFGSGAEVIPYIVSKTAESVTRIGSPIVLILMLTAALGSGGAITRATGSALATVVPSRRIHSRAHSAISLLFALWVAARGAGIIHTIVGLNIVFIASIAVLLMSRKWRSEITERGAAMIMMAGFLPSALFYLLGVMGFLTHHADAWSLLLGIAASGVSWFALQRRMSRFV